MNGPNASDAAHVPLSAESATLTGNMTASGNSTSGTGGGDPPLTGGPLALKLVTIMLGDIDAVRTWLGSASDIWAHQ